MKHPSITLIGQALKGHTFESPVALSDGERKLSHKLLLGFDEDGQPIHYANTTPISWDEKNITDLIDVLFWSNIPIYWKRDTIAKYRFRVIDRNDIIDGARRWEREASTIEAEEEMVPYDLPDCCPQSEYGLYINGMCVFRPNLGHGHPRIENAVKAIVDQHGADAVLQHLEYGKVVEFVNGGDGIAYSNIDDMRQCLLDDMEENDIWTNGLKHEALEAIGANVVIKWLEGRDYVVKTDLQYEAETKEISIDPDGPVAGASFYAEDCKELIRSIVQREGWDELYRIIEHKDLMKVQNVTA